MDKKCPLLCLNAKGSETGCTYKKTADVLSGFFVFKPDLWGQGAGSAPEAAAETGFIAAA